MCLTGGCRINSAHAHCSNIPTFFIHFFSTLTKLAELPGSAVGSTRREAERVRVIRGKVAKFTISTAVSSCQSPDRHLGLRRAALLTFLFKGIKDYQRHTRHHNAV